MSTYGRKAIGTIAYMGGVPAVLEQFAWSWGQMIQYNSEYVVQANERIHYDRATISFHAAARNLLVQQMHGDWLLMLDTDHAFEPDLCARMLHRMQADDLDVLTGMYVQKAQPHMPLIYAEREGMFCALADWDKPSERYLIPVASAGAGCLLVKRKVFDRCYEELKESPFDIIHPYGEDHSFFKRLQKLGIQAYCDPSIEAWHLTVRGLSLETFEANKSDLNIENVVGK